MTAARDRGTARSRSTRSLPRSSRRCSPRRTRGSGPTAASTGYEVRQALGYRRGRLRLELGAAIARRSWRAARAAHPTRRRRVRGASTITQQLAKNLYLSPVAESAPEAQGGGHRLPAGAGARQGPDPRALPQRGGAGRRGVGRGGGEPALLPDAGPPAHAHAGRRARRHAAVPAELQPGLPAAADAAAAGPDPAADAGERVEVPKVRGGADPAAGRQHHVDAGDRFAAGFAAGAGGDAVGAGRESRPRDTVAP